MKEFLLDLKDGIIKVFIGARLPIVIGTSFTFVGIFTTIGLSNGGGVN